MMPAFSNEGVVQVTDWQFSDDAAVVGDSRESIVIAAERLVEVLSE